MSRATGAELEGKRVLFISPRFFNYEIEISQEIENLGAQVDWFDERGNPSTLQKLLLRKAKFLALPYVNRYYQKLITSFGKNRYDFVLFISPESATPKILRQLKRKQSKARFILYMWDSVRNKNSKKILQFFDSKFSFDKGDCRRYGMKFRPLFFSRDFTGTQSNEKNHIDCSFIGTIHSDRFTIIRNIQEALTFQGKSTFLYMYFPSRILYKIMRLLDPHLRATLQKRFAFAPLPFNEVVMKLKETCVILDIQHPKQTGLTMRTVEVLGLGKKLITTNTDIVNYDFFHENNIIVIDRRKPRIPVNFFDSSYTPIPLDVIGRYSITAWIKELFLGSKANNQ